MSVLVLLETVEDAARLFAEGHAFSMLNIGNVHHMPGHRSFTNAVFLGDTDVDLLRTLFSRGVHVEIRTLPKKFRSTSKERLRLHRCLRPNSPLI